MSRFHCSTHSVFSVNTFPFWPNPIFFHVPDIYMSVKGGPLGSTKNGFTPSPLLLPWDRPMVRQMLFLSAVAHFGRPKVSLVEGRTTTPEGWMNKCFANPGILDGMSFIKSIKKSYLYMNYISSYTNAASWCGEHGLHL